MSRMQNRIDVEAEINACERIRAFDETRLNLELSRAGVDLDGLTLRLEGELGIAHEATRPPALPDIAYDPKPSAASASAISAPAPEPEPDTFELAGIMKFFDARRGFGFFVADSDTDDNGGDVLVHVLHLRSAGYQTAYEGARIHAIVHRTPKGLQVSRILSMDQSSAVHPSQLPQRTREKVQPESDWVCAEVKWYNCEKGYGFVCEGQGSPDAMIHADTLRRWGVAPLASKQLVEIRWGMSSKGRMVVEIRYLHGLSGLPPVH